MKLLTFLLFILIGTASCTVQKVYKAYDGSKSDGTLTMMYEYGSFETPEVQWEESKKKAVEKCQQWGYSDAEFFEAGNKECVQPTYSGCNRWRVTRKVTCIEGEETESE